MITIQKPVTVHRVREWPNKLGFDCRVNSVRFEVVFDRELRRFHAIRVYRGELMQQSRLEWPDTDNLQEAAELVFIAWRDKREIWTD